MHILIRLENMSELFGYLHKRGKDGWSACTYRCSGTEKFVLLYSVCGNMVYKSEVSKCIMCMYYLKVFQPVTKSQILYDSTNTTYLGKSYSYRQKAEWWLVNGKLFNGHRVLILQDEKTTGDWLCNKDKVLMPLNCTFQNDEVGKLCYILSFF